MTDAARKGIRTLAASAFSLAAFVACAGEYVFEEDFSVKDERNRAYGIDIEENTSYAHGHGRVADGKYEIVVQGNRHFLATPKLRDFSLELGYSIKPYKHDGEVGFMTYFRWDREARRGDVLSVFHDKEWRLHVLLNGKEVFTRQDTEDVPLEGRTMRLSVKGARANLDLSGTKLSFDVGDGPAGYVGFDTMFSPSLLMTVSKVRLESDSAPEKTKVRDYAFVLDRAQAAQTPIRCDVSLSRYASGETELAYRFSGTVADFTNTVETGGSEWGRVVERLTEPYLRIETPDGEYGNFLAYNGFRTLRCTLPIRGATADNTGWPAEGAYVFRDFPDDFVLVAGYGRFMSTPWRFAANGPYEQIRSADGSLVYEGDSVRGARVAVKATPPADNAIARDIPRDVPRYEEAVAHARRGGFFREGEQVSFAVETVWRADRWSKAEVLERPVFTTVFGEPLEGEAAVEELSDERLPGGLRRVRQRVTPAKNPGHGVWKLALRGGKVEIFEVVSNDPSAVPPPIASGLPFLVSMPNETKYLEQNAFDPWNFFNGIEHYYAVDNQYPVVGETLQVWRLLPLYNRGWWCWNWSRNSDDYDQYTMRNRAIIRNCRYFGGYDNRSQKSARYDFSWLSAYNDAQLKLVRDYVAERRPPLKRLTLGRLDECVKANKPFSFEELRDLFDTCWDDFIAWARPRIKAAEQRFTDYILGVNPSVGLATYGPFPVYVARYKTAYVLKYMGYPLEDDPRVRENDSFWLFEEYHHSCDYPVYRAALFVTSYCMNHPGGRKIYPEIYTSSWGRCADGAVFQAHPFPGGRYVRDSHQRKVAYTYAYGTPYFKDGRYSYWRDWGFHARNPEREAMEELVYAWGRMYRNQPERSAKAAFIAVDEAQIARHGEYFDDECNSSYFGENLADICNTAEEGLAYAYEKAVEAGYNTPVLTTLAELDSITPDMADFVMLPPIVEGTPEAHVAAVRRAWERGVNLLCTEDCVGLEDVFGVKRAAKDRKVGYVKGESFSHKTAVAKYEADGAKTTLFGAADIDSPRDIPVVMAREGRSRTVFVNLPPASVRKNSFRQHFHWGSDSISTTMRRAMRESFAFLAPSPAVKTERGNAVACFTGGGDLVVVVSDDSPNYNDPEAYPATFRFEVSVPGVGGRAIESDARYTVVERSADRLVIRAETDKDTAYFFKFSRR